MTYSAANRKDIRRAEKQDAEDERARTEFVVAAMGTIQGRVWFHDLLSFCHIFADPYTGDAFLDNFNKGQRNIGLMIYNTIVTHCPNEFIIMMNEAKIKEISNARSNNGGGRRSPGDDLDASSYDSAYDDTTGTGPEYTGSTYG